MKPILYVSVNSNVGFNFIISCEQFWFKGASNTTKLGYFNHNMSYLTISM